VILKNNFTPKSMWPYARFGLALGGASSLAAWLLVDRAGVHWLALPGSLATVLGTALSILLAVRVNVGYQRWWEASGIWAQITALSRNLARVVIAVGDSKRATTQNAAAITAFQRGMIEGQIAWANALRLQLRGESDWASLAARLAPEEYQRVVAADNKASLLLQMHSQRIFRAYADGVLTGLDNFQMEVALAALAQQQALAERTRSQPVPRVYDIFSRYFVHIYLIVFPFCIIGALADYRWVVIPATLILSFAFRIVERIGAVVENPFANTIQDVPLTAICVTIERDLLEQLGEATRPAALQPVNGYLM
jgi:putative membrane protein